MSALIDIRDLSVSYDGKPALCNVNLQIEEREFLGLSGPNGGGKTTLLKAILGLVAYSGRIDYADGLRRRIGYLPQTERFDTAFPLSVRELVLSGLQAEKGLSGRYTKADKSRAEEWIARCDLRAVAHKAVGEVSGGELQRALLCRAMIASPRLLILDEPANFVDEGFREALYALLRQANRSMAVVMVSHEITALESIASRIVLIEGGVLKN